LGLEVHPENQNLTLEWLLIVSKVAWFDTLIEDYLINSCYGCILGASKLGRIIDSNRLYDSMTNE